MGLKVQDCMSIDPVIISKSTPVQEAAVKMRELDCGFLPVGDGERLEGVITDRDIILRALAERKDPELITVGAVMSPGVLYCYQHDSLREATHLMREYQVHRLVVLTDRNMKRLCGVISLGDIARVSAENQLVGETTQDIICGLPEQFAVAA